MTRLSSRARAARGGIAAGIALILAAMAVRLPQILPLPCAFHVLTGLPCVFCGGTRAVQAAIHGRWELALYLNPLAFPALFGAALAGVTLVIEAAQGRTFCHWEALLAGRTARMAAALCLAFWVSHLVLALKTPKPELVDLRNPLAEKLRFLFVPAGPAGQ